MTSDQNKDVQNLDDIREVVENIGSTRADLIPVLQAITNKFGYISQSAIKELSGLMGLPTKEIFSVATFYRMLSTQPRGKHVIQFCESAPCHVVGGREVFLALQEALNLEPGQTSPDNKWTLLTTSCLGVCGVGPVILIDTDMYGNVTPEQVKIILSRYD
ncbi:MAG TPA: NADH-quinone oxidoreductase subunit NuoE [Brevefilum fermentans]|jgi:NADH-quinone oxidoreductase subunit E|uniref:NADH dehydrogenase I, E subunit n=1 Tax=Candidatus Brevifilum fermentans TaxID=1986204 RepID=A0A1Y6K6R3_9CHLR|nr:NADH-quinone oxidoreductase subunit NuoE [Brevefilum fermentans]MDI9566978.1 NADH-quinone oxidoreductase subunit NuoE [Chloroflexota bacterium]SMX54279.1 NADH dehydrogenase I, E subunit [Brevefilum fermentans]HQA29153.1 NADH-quinone oxidoreductase subunit NuoE [Brevefilum fermentans]